MAIQWGPVSGHLRVGIDVRTSAYDWTTPTIDVYVDFWVRTEAWGFNRAMTVQSYGSFMGPNLPVQVTSGTGQTVEIFAGTVTISGIGPIYGGGPYYEFGGVTTNNNQGPNPSQVVGWTVPAKPPGPPEPPGVFISNLSATDVILNVTASPNERGSTVHTYLQEIRTWPGDVLHSSWTGGTRWASPPPLTRATQYYGRSKAINYVGESAWAIQNAFVTLSLPPSAPQTFARGLEGPDSVPLTWAAPADNGGAFVTGYIIQASTDPAFGGTPLTKVVGNVLAATMDGLTPGLTYNFRVRAKNSVGDGAWSSVITGTTLATNTVKVPGLGWRPVRAWVKVPLIGWVAATIWKRPAGSGGVYRT